MKTQKTVIPIWYWIISVFFLVWNVMGINTFFQQLTMSDGALKALPILEQELYNSYPIWTYVAFALAVFGGTIGSVGLILRKKWSKLFFIISLFAIIPQMLQNLFFTKAREVYGAGTEIMPVLIIVFGIFLVWFSDFGIKKKWLK